MEVLWRILTHGPLEGLLVSVAFFYTISNFGSNQTNKNSEVTVPARGNASLQTQLRLLGCAPPAWLSIKNDGWINSHCLVFNTCSTAPSFDQHSTDRFNYLAAEHEAITFKVYHDHLIGKGSMQSAYKAKVKSGSGEIFDYVAKIWHHNKEPNTKHYASNALMYCQPPWCQGL